jgi:hypothetical protein
VAGAETDAPFMAVFSASARCASCGSPLVEISIARGESTMTMRSCSTCDTRWWHDDGDMVDLDHVLDTMASDRRR